MGGHEKEDRGGRIRGRRTWESTWGGRTWWEDKAGGHRGGHGGGGGEDTGSVEVPHVSWVYRI